MIDRLKTLFTLDVRSIAAFRIALGVAIVLDLVTRAFDMRAFYTDEGVLPRVFFFRSFDGPSRDDAYWSLHAATGSIVGESALFAVAAVVAVALALGWRSRIMCFASLVLAISLQDRNPAVFYGFDLLLRASLMWACFLPLGARFSLDGKDDGKDEVCSPGTVALVVQTVALYVFCGLQKVQSPSWRDLSAVFLAFTTDTHATVLARAVAAHADVTRALTALTVAVELFVPLLLLVPTKNVSRLRLVVIAVFTVFHLANACFLKLGLFPLLGIFAWIPFLPARVWGADPERNRNSGPQQRSSSSRPAYDGQGPHVVLVGALLAVVLAFNVETVTSLKLLPKPVRRIGLVLHLEQTWNMFVRPMADGWFVARATLADGRVVDVMKRGAEVTFDKPESVSSSFPSMRWRKYVTNLVRPTGVRHRRAFLRYLCDGWNDGADPGAHADRIELWFVREVERIDGAAPSVSRELLDKLACPAP